MPYTLKMHNVHVHTLNSEIFRRAADKAVVYTGQPQNKIPWRYNYWFNRGSDFKSTWQVRKEGAVEDGIALLIDINVERVYILKVHLPGTIEDNPRALIWNIGFGRQYNSFRPLLDMCTRDQHECETLH